LILETAGAHDTRRRHAEALARPDNGVSYSSRRRTLGQHNS
jgi:hypothetical protein